MSALRQNRSYALRRASWTDVPWMNSEGPPARRSRRSEYAGQVRPVQAYVAVLSVQSNLSRHAVYSFLRSGEKIPIVAIKRVQVILAP
jgi:hypothetical protein